LTPVRFPAGRGRDSFILTTAVSRPALGCTQPPLHWVSGAVSSGVKGPGLEADHSLPSSADVKNSWSYTFTPPYVFIAWYLVKQRDNFTFTFLCRSDTKRTSREVQIKLTTELLFAYNGMTMQCGYHYSIARCA